MNNGLAGNQQKSGVTIRNSLEIITYIFLNKIIYHFLRKSAISQLNANGLAGIANMFYI